MAFLVPLLPYITAATGVIGAIGAIRQGQAARAAGDYNAKVAEQNAQLARQKAAFEASQQRRENILRLGAIRANMGASGGTAAGSAIDVLGDVVSQGEMQAQQITYGGELEARGQTNTAKIERFSGRQAQAGSYMRAGSELLSGVSGGIQLKRT